MKFFKPVVLFVFVIAGFSASAQNNAPVITNITALADTVFHKLSVTFDVVDAENDSMEIFLSVSADSGFSFPFNTDNATGDAAFPVMQGNSKRIEWYYPDSISAMLPRCFVRLAADDRALDIQEIVDQIDTNRLRQNLLFIEGIRHRTTGPIHLQQVRDSLSTIFQRNGLQTRIHPFLYGGSYTGNNMVGRKPGVARDTRTIIVDGHYDTVDDSPGADDNGSSIAALLEILRVIAPLKLASTVEFIGFDLEESGLSGSEAYVVDGIQPYEDIAGVINMDMIAYYSNQPNSQTVPPLFDVVFPDLYARLVADSFRANFIISTANTFSLPLMHLFDSMATRYVPGLIVGSIQVPGNGEAIPDARRSDHAAFWDSGYVALHLSDGAETRNPNYHSPADVESTVNYNFMGNVTKAVTATLLDLVKPLHADVEVATIAPDPASGIWQMEEDGCRLLVSPNPSNGQFKINIENCRGEAMTFRVFSLEGKLIWQSERQRSKEVELSNSVESGYYIVEVSNPQSTRSKKIFVR